MPRIRVLQTSDLHLRNDCPERLAVLNQVLDLAMEKSVDLVLIAGDLIDRTTATAETFADIRKSIERYAPLPVVILAGNHDQELLSATTDLGNNSICLTETPTQKVTVCGLDLIGIPWQADRTVSECLVGVSMDPRHTILIAHALHTTGLENVFCGEGQEGACMPAFRDDLLRRCTYAALGHVHSGTNLIHREEERLIGYSGSPIAISFQEIGQRGVLLVDYEPSVGVVQHEFHTLPTPYYELAEICCQPGREEEALLALAQKSVTLRGPRARVRARLSGLALRTRTSLQSTLTGMLASSFPPGADSSPTAARLLIEIETEDFSSLAGLPVVHEFIEKLLTTPPEGLEQTTETTQEALRLGLEAFREGLL